MPWGRIALGLIVFVFGLGSIVWTTLIVAGAARVTPPPAAGLNESDAAALGAPFEYLSSGRDGELIGRLVDAANPQQAQAEIDRIQAFLPSEQPTSSRLVVYQSYVGTDGLRLTGTYEHTYPAHVARVETSLYRSSATQPWRVAGFHVNVATKAELGANKLSLAGKPPSFLAFIAATIVNPLFLLFTFIAALFWKGLRNRWVWLVATLLGVGTFTMNGVSGAISFSPISFQLLGASALWSGSAFDAWMFGVSLPLGATAFWLTRMFSRAPNLGEETAKA